MSNIVDKKNILSEGEKEAVSTLLSSKEGDISFELTINNVASRTLKVFLAKKKNVYLELPFKTKEDEVLADTLEKMIADENIESYYRYLVLLEKKEKANVEMRHAKMVMDRIETALKYSGLEVKQR